MASFILVGPRPEDQPHAGLPWSTVPCSTQEQPIGRLCQNPGESVPSGRESAGRRESQDQSRGLSGRLRSAPGEAAPEHLPYSTPSCLCVWDTWASTGLWSQAQHELSQPIGAAGPHFLLDSASSGLARSLWLSMGCFYEPPPRVKLEPPDKPNNVFLFFSMILTCVWDGAPLV